MNLRECYYYVVIWIVMVSIPCLYGITIDGQLTVIKNDCYDRMAIGEKLSPKQTYKTFDHNTVMKCEQECTEEREACRAFSFGIGLKGNATCLLSKNPIKETGDLKPIGTVTDTDYDLYIKKLDCQVVHEPPHFPESHGEAEVPQNFRPQAYSGHNDYGEHGHHNGPKDHYGANGNVPEQSTNFNSVSKPNYGPENGYQYDKPSNPYSPQEPPHKNPSENNIHHVQTLVSIASGPQSVLHPVHEILVSGGMDYGQGKPTSSSQLSGGGYGNYNDNMPPFRPPTLNHPYDDHRPQMVLPLRPIPEDYDRPDRPRPEHGNLRPGIPRPGYGSAEYASINTRPNLSYPNDFNRPYRPERPPYQYQPNEDRPDPDYGTRPLTVPDTGYGSGGQLTIDRRKYESSNQFNSFATESFSYRPEQPPRNPTNYNFYDHYDKPNYNQPNRYGSVIPHPNDYNRPEPHYDYLFVRPNYESYDDRRPPLGPLRPENDNRKPVGENVNQGYGGPGRPLGGLYGPNFDDGRYGDKRPLNTGDNIKLDYGKPSRPTSDMRRPTGYDEPNSTRPTKPSSSTSRPPSTELTNHYGGVDYTNKQYGKPGEILNNKGNDDTRKIVSQSVGYHGEQITSIITELKNACFRRTLAGKRVVRGLVRKLLVCDTVEQCQLECGDEKHFTCEGFNYRLDPTGRGKGDCELLDLPLLRIDITREVVTDRDYDYYTRDRNAGHVNCRQPPSNNYFPGNGYRRGGQQYGERYDYEEDGGYRRGDRPRPFDQRPTDIGIPLRRPGDRWEGDYDDRSRPSTINRRPLPEDDRRYEDGNRRGDYSFHHSHESHSSHSYHYNEHNVDSYDHDRHQENRPYTGIHYLPASNDRIPYHDSHSRPYDRHNPPKKYPVIIQLDEKHHDNPLPSDHRYPVDRYPSDRYPTDRRPDKDYWGLDKNTWGTYGGHYGNFGYSDVRYGYGAQQNRYRYSNDHRNYYIPSNVPRPEVPNDWGLYGGSYGNGGLSLEYQGYGDKHYSSLNNFHTGRRPILYDSDLLPPRKPGDYLPIQKPFLDKTYLPLPKPNKDHYLPSKPRPYELENSILPAEPRRPPNYNFIRDECSLRSATGFRLHKGIVKKFFSVSSIYECELLCVREKEFPCASYAYRYTVIFSPQTENCYLSNRNYKELDYYTDVEPDRDFDIYTMNNRNRCDETIIYSEKEDSDCFWRVRSGTRLDQSVVRDSLTVKSIVDCQLECLQSRRFTCRVYSFRYGSPVIGGAIDNCQLTDWPFIELVPRTDFIPESGYEVYERGSYGHGCEPDHFGIRGKNIIRNGEIKTDQLCYIGFGSAARLLPQATIKSLYVPTELDCKVECSKAREGTLFRCMSFSFTTEGPKVGHNCFLSDIMQRDLLPNVDYVHDPDSWLFTWDNYNSECINLANKPLHNDQSETKLGYTEKYGPGYLNPLDVWRVYSVSGWPCRRGTLCEKNRITGFWYCELEGGENNAWDYCCSPNHQCGFSNGYPYSWCYVGPTRTQWRKCNDQYYPYIHNALDRYDSDRRPWHTSGHLSPPIHTSGFRPDRPNAPQRPVPSRPSLDEYEQEFDKEFLSPPKPGGFGLPRRWPVAYLHKEMPPNSTETDTRSMRTEKKENSKLSAIKNLIDVIQNNDFKHVQYHIANDSNKPDDILYVKIPLPHLNKPEQNSSTEAPKKSNEVSSNTRVKFEVVDTAPEQSARVQKSAPVTSRSIDDGGANDWTYSVENFTRSPAFRRGFVTRTNLTSIRSYRS